MSKFLDLGFDNTVTESTEYPSRDGYVCSKNGYPYHVHPTATPIEWEYLNAAINNNEVVVCVYIPEDLNKPEIKISRAKVYLESTDFKMLPDYTPRPDGESIEDIKLKRSEARELIRQLEQGVM